ncbi:MAG: aspartyl protease family protein [Blastocatellia bacterium]
MVCAALFRAADNAPATNGFALRAHMIIVPVMVNGAAPRDFLLDTGSNTTLVTPEFARQLRLRPHDRVELVTVAGTQLVPRARLDRLEMGGQALADVEALIGDLREIRGVAPDVAGVLGQNFLTRFSFVIDYRAQKLLFETGTELENSLCGARLPLENHEDRWLVRARVNEQAGLFVPDTGIDSLLLFVRGARLIEQTLPAGSSLARTDAGTRAARQWRVPRLGIGPVVFRDFTVTMFPAGPADAERIEDGLLPLCLFDRVYFNHRRGYLILNPRHGK